MPDRARSRRRVAGPRDRYVRLGLAKREIRVVPYDRRWAREFRNVRTRLRLVLPSARIEHVGSTAVPGCDAKPVIDVSVGLAPTARLRIGAARSIGLEFRSVSPESTHFVFRDGRGGHLAHIHVNPLDSEAEKGLLQFRDYLRTHPAALGQYIGLKHHLLATLRNAADYTAAKEPFIRRLEPKIRRWAKRTHWSPGRAQARA